jgi:C4-dicarboxylate-binding protein DctP
MKTRLVVIGTIGLCLLLAGVGTAAEYKMRLSHQLPETHFLSDLVKRFEKMVEERTGGKIDVEVYPAAQAFKPKEVIGAVVGGAIESGMALNFQWAGIIPVMDTFIIPYFITDLDTIEKVIDGEIGDRLFAMMSKKGVVPLMWLLQTRNNIYTSNETLLKMPEDFAGKKMRGTSKIMNLGSEALGASTMPVSGPEVYTALQRGTLDIGLTGVGAALARHYYEVQKYGTVASTFSVVHIIFVSPAFWKTLPADLRKTVRECAEEIQALSLPESEKSKENAIVELKKHMTIHIQTPKEAAAWKAVMQPPVLDYFLEKNGDTGKKIVEAVKLLQ